MQYKVPQGIDMQDRILGPLTLVQFGFVLFGGLISYFLYLKLPPAIRLWVAMLFMALSVFVSFEYVRRMILAGISFVLKPRSRVWRKAFNPTPITYKPRSRGEKKPAKTEKPKTPEDFSRLADTIDSHGQKY